MKIDAETLKKQVILHLPYLLFLLVFAKLGEAVRLAPGADASQKLLGLSEGFALAFQNMWPGAAMDWLIGLCGAAIMRLAVYLRGKDAKKYRKNVEYGSARWGNKADIAPFMDPKPENNIILTQSEGLMLNGRPKNPANARNKNVLVVGGSGSGKTRFFIKPNLMQMHSSYVVTDPKGTVLVECGKMLQRGTPKLDKDGKPVRNEKGKIIYEPYKIRVFNTINFQKSMHFNPFAYIHSEKDILKIVTTLIANTKGEGKAGDDFWVKAETLLYTALIGYIYYEAPVNEQNFATLVEMLNAMEVREDDESFKNAVVIYGYLWDEKREHWLVDEEAAEVVRRIFSLTLEGYGPYQIACKLSADRIEIPVVHLARFNEGVNRSKPVKDPYGWGSSTIVNILKKREYLGHTINFKTRKHFKDKKSHYVSEDEWTIFENTHEAIIDQQTFDLVQKIRSNVRRYPNGWGEAAPLTGLLYCADCGGKMYVHRTNNGKRISQYTCSNYTKVPCGTLCLTQHRINESAVLTLVSDTLRAIAEYSRNDRTEFIHTVQETQVAQQSADISKKRRRLAAAQKRAGELEKLICKIYEDNALGKLPDTRYKALDAQYAKEQDALEIEIAELEKAVTGYEQSQKSAEKFIALIDKYENFDTLTNTMLNEFVEKILVHERSRKGSQDTTQEIEIYFNFLGRYIPPSLQPVPLTPEEQEELRKREERKDRLHQNYLKRKASGAQKRYEDKIKAKKKAEMDAKKALIRAEDMKKGVFSTIGQLPKEEPRKGSIAASAAV